MSSGNKTVPPKLEASPFLSEETANMLHGCLEPFAEVVEVSVKVNGCANTTIKNDARVKSETRDAINSHLLSKWGFPDDNYKNYKKSWMDVERCLNIPHLASQGLKYLAQLTMTRTEIADDF